MNDFTKHQLNAETARIRWSELQRHFARGAVVTVGRDLDLVAVGADIVADDKSGISRLIENGQLARTSDAEARRWAEDDAQLWCLVVPPWVLVQEPSSD